MNQKTTITGIMNVCMCSAMTVLSETLSLNICTHGDHTNCHGICVVCISSVLIICQVRHSCVININNPSRNSFQNESIGFYSIGNILSTGTGAGDKLAVNYNHAITYRKWQWILKINPFSREKRWYLKFNVSLKEQKPIVMIAQRISLSQSSQCCNIYSNFSSNTGIW